MSTFDFWGTTVTETREPWLLFDPTGEFDGLIWSPNTLDEAQRKFARPRRWTTLAREGWNVRRGIEGEHHALTAAKVAEMATIPPAPDRDASETRGES